MEIQVKLLQVIQEKVIYRIGAPDPVHVDVRIIAATNKDLPSMVSAGKFREDLYYRLAVVPIVVLPLRERKNDIIPLILACLNRLNEKFNMSKFFTVECINAMADYSWPGNVRELHNLVERLMIVTKSDKIEYSDLPAGIQSDLSHESDYVNMTLKQATRLFEQELIKKTVRHIGSVRKAAESLAVNPSTITRKLQK